MPLTRVLSRQCDSEWGVMAGANKDMKIEANVAALNRERQRIGPLSTQPMSRWQVIFDGAD